MEYKSQSITQQLADYIKNNLKKGYTIDSLRFSLFNQGYSKISVDNAIELVNKQLAEEIPKIKEKPQITYRIVSDNSNSEDNDSSEITISNSNQKKGFWKRLFGF